MVMFSIRIEEKWSKIVINILNTFCLTGHGVYKMPNVVGSA